MKEKTVKNKATLAHLRSNIRQGAQDWALAKKVRSPARSMLPGARVGRARADSTQVDGGLLCPLPRSDPNLCGAR